MMKLPSACFLLPLTLFACAAARANTVFSVGTANSQDPNACGPRSVGLLDGDTAKWVAGSCIPADEWIDDAETASALESGIVIVYTNPGLGADTNLYVVDFGSKNVSRVLVGGDEGELRCAADGGKLSCYGVSPGDDNDVTQLIRVDGRTGGSLPVLNLSKYEGYSVGGSVIDPVNLLYHFVAVGDPHLPPPPSLAPVRHATHRVPRRRCKRGISCSPPPLTPASTNAEPSDQWLVTIDLRRMLVIAHAPLTRNFMGPLSVSAAHVRGTASALPLRALNMHSHRAQGLATFNAEGFNGLVAIDYKSGALQPLLLADFGSILQFCGAFSRNMTFVASAYPSPTRFYSLRLSSHDKPEVVANSTFDTNGIVYAAPW